ncbi:phosphoserine phosphatase SerB [Desulforhopalus vacuolatus]|uniref:phosphoserine phosphatase SerB n=1 Tax=Desulforhopalus vacuolatus TaxID=40414 RepID=UPI001962AF91|nr:phosphoserine phosphatase SerB [Desulforhopalus vacuolatus]MBM9520858.1 phosphoserine phosphatase SerB [Desulforhopalus vacuolatus]
MKILTLVASDQPLQPDLLQQVRALVDCIRVEWLAPQKAVEMHLAGEKELDRAALAALLAPCRIDHFLQDGDAPRRKKLLISDMDATLVAEETLDELSASIGLKDKIAAITARSMAGELDFHEALRTRIDMLRGLPESAIGEHLQHLPWVVGARELVATMVADGAATVLVSGGFTCFTGAVAEKLGMQYHHGNTLIIKDGVLTGEVHEPILGREAKLEFLHQYQQQYGLQRGDILAIGDGANDLEMLRAAGLGVGFHPKEFLRRQVENSILYGDLTALLYAQGYRTEEIISS